MMMENESIDFCGGISLCLRDGREGRGDLFPRTLETGLTS